MYKIIPIGASVAMAGKENGIAAKSKKLPQCENIMSVHCIYHWSALSCTDAGDDLQFIIDFENIMMQLGAFFKNLPKQLKIYIKTEM